MDARTLAIRLAVLVAGLVLGIFPGIANAAHSLGAMGLEPSAHIGWEANETTGASVCTVASYDTCQASLYTTRAGGFNYPGSIGADPRTGGVYVAEANNARVQLLTATGAFVSMFGWGVNKTEDKRSTATRVEKDFCTVASKDVCGSGVMGTGTGQLDTPAGVAVDPRSGDVYVLGIGPEDVRVDKYAPDGRFLWRIGKGVNTSTKGNRCTAREVEQDGVSCGPGALNGDESSEAGAFKVAEQPGDLLAVGGPGDQLYVGDEHRVQVFGANGVWKREIPLISISAEKDSNVVALALEQSGDLYLIYRVGNGEVGLPAERANVVHKLDFSGEQIAEYLIKARIPGASVSVNGLADDGSGWLAMMGFETGDVGSLGRFTALYDAGTGELLTRMTPPPDNDGIAFNTSSELFVATAVDQEVEVYAPDPLPELALELVPCEVMIGEGSPEASPCYASGQTAVRE